MSNVICMFSSSQHTYDFPSASWRKRWSYFTTCSHLCHLAIRTMISLYADSGAHMLGSAFAQAAWNNVKQVPHHDTSGISFGPLFLELDACLVGEWSPPSCSVLLQSPSLGPSSKTGNHANSTNDFSWIISTSLHSRGGRFWTRCTTFGPLFFSFSPAKCALELSRSFLNQGAGSSPSPLANLVAPLS